jgi:hypothetical protein
MEADSRRGLSSTRPALPDDDGRARPGPVTRRRVGCLVVLAGLAAGCVAPNVGGPAGPPTDPSGRLQVPAGDGSAAPVGPGFVPPGLVGTNWFAPGAAPAWVAGIAGSSERLELPESELPIEAGGGLVASVGPRSGEAGSIVRVREIATGRVVTEVTRPENVDLGLLAGDWLVIAGHDPVEPSVSVSLVDGSVRELIAAGPLPDGWSGSAARTLAASPSGRTIASGLCLEDRCAIDIIEPSSGSVRRIAASIEAFPGPMTDEVLIVARDDLSGVAALEITSGEQLWQRSGAEFQHAYVTSDGRYVLSYLDHREPWRFRVSVIDPRTNEERVVLEADPNEGLTLWPDLSSDGLAAIGVGGRFEDVAQGSALVRARVLDLASGELVPGGISILVGR